MEYLAEFDGWKLRAVTEADREQLDAWIAADPAHVAKLEPDFFLGLEVNAQGQLAADPRATCYALEDETGTVFFIRLSRAARVNIQFPPARDLKIRADAERTALALVQGMAFLEVALGRAGVEEWIFSTESPKLQKLAVRALGFIASPREMVRAISGPNEARNRVVEATTAGRKRDADVRT